MSIMLVENSKKPQINADERRFNDANLSPQRTLRAQSIDTIIFASFALFAVRFVRHLTMLLGTTVEALG